MNSIGVVILDKLINDLKSKLPQKDKKLEDIGAESEQEEEKTDPSRSSAAVTGVTTLTTAKAASSDSLFGKIKSKINGSAKAADEEGDATPSEASKKKKKISIILQVVIAAGAVLIIFSDDIFPPEPEQVQPAVNKPKRQKPDPSVAQTGAEVKPEAPTEPVAQTDPVTTEPASDPAATTDPLETEPNSTTPTEPIVAEPSATEPTITEPVSTEPVETTAPVVETTPVENSDVTTTENVSEMIAPVTNPSEKSADVVNDDQVSSTEDNITDQILRDLEGQAKIKSDGERKEYVSPPDYEYKGRGLVYNCSGKHWACVDGPSYKICEDNAVSLKQAKKKAECYPFNVYETVKGCENIQYRMISSNAKTNFCVEN